MKIVIPFLSLISTYASTYGQSKDEDYKTMIDSAIVIQTMRIDNVFYSPDIYLIDAKDQAYSLTSDRDQKKFKYINVYDQKNRKLLRNGVKAWKVLPVLTGNKLVVSIIEFTVTYKNKNYNYANGGGATVVFEYSCDKSKWEFRESKWSGI